MSNQSATVEDKNLIECLLFMKQNKFLGEFKSSRIFESPKEAEDSAKEDISLAVREYLNNLKQDISLGQKKGYNLKLEGINLLKVPLKLKVWQSTFQKKDLEAIYTIMKSIEPQLSIIKKEIEELERQNS